MNHFFILDPKKGGVNDFETTRFGNNCNALWFAVTFMSVEFRLPWYNAVGNAGAGEFGRNCDHRPDCRFESQLIGFSEQYILSASVIL